ncbi:MAG: DNA repair protein [Cyanobacteria bacterium P01_G01_bin.49]
MIDKQSEKQVLSILLMRFEVKPARGIQVAQEWLKQHPQSNWQTLLTLLKDNRLNLVDGSLKETSKSTDSTQPKMVRKYRGVEIPVDPSTNQTSNQSPGKTRQYRGVKY